MAVAAIAAPVARMNGVHMTGRLAAAFAIYLLTLNAATTGTRVRAAVALAVATAVIVSALVVLEYFRVPAVLEWLKAFRPFSTSVGALVRAGGPLQYPTIASMYLEVVFACGLGLMVAAAAGSRPAAVGALFAGLLLIAYAITLTFTAPASSRWAPACCSLPLSVSGAAASTAASHWSACSRSWSPDCFSRRDRRSRCGCG